MLSQFYCQGSQIMLLSPGEISIETHPINAKFFYDIHQALSSAIDDGCCKIVSQASSAVQTLS